MTSDDEDEWIMDTKMLTGTGAADDGREWADAAGFTVAADQNDADDKECNHD